MDKKRDDKKPKIKELIDNDRVRDELLRHNNSLFDFRNQKIPFAEIVKVRMDATVSSLLESRLSGITALKYTLSGENEERVKFINDALKKIKVGSIVRGAFNAVVFGFCPSVIKWNVTDGKLLPEKLIFRSPRGWRTGKETHGEDTDDLYYQDNLQKTIKAGDYPYQIIPVFRNRDDIFPLGEGILEKLFWYVQYLNAGLDFWAKFAQRFGMPFIYTNYPQGSEKSLIKKLQELLSRFAGSMFGIFPEGVDIKAFEPFGKGQSSQVYKDLLQFCRENISMAILGHTGAAVSTSGKLGGDATALTVRDDIALSDSVIIENFINDLIDKIIALNFGEAGGVSFEFYKENANEKLAQRDKILSDCGAKFTQKYFSQTYAIAEDLLQEETAKNTVQFAANAYDFSTVDLEENTEKLFKEFLAASSLFYNLKAREVL